MRHYLGALRQRCVYLLEYHSPSARGLYVAADKKEDQSVAKAAFKSTYAMPEFRAVLQPKVADFDAERQKWRVEVERDLHTIKETVLPEHPGIAHFVDKDSGCVPYTCTRVRVVRMVTVSCVTTGECGTCRTTCCACETM